MQKRFDDHAVMAPVGVYLAVCNFGELVLTTPLSIVLPVYNAEETLGEQVQDVFDIMENITSQFEILVVDDASTDATEQAAYDLICQFSQVRVVRHGRRLGTSEAIQTGLQLSEGQAVFVHKEHEPLQPHHLERFIEARQQPPVLHQPILKDPPPMGAVA